MKKSLIALATFMACSFSLTLIAQTNQDYKEVSTWFLEARFLIADQNDDALLERSEMEAFSNEFAYYLQERNYELADANQDGFLSFNELNTRRRSENIYLFTQQRKELREIARDFPLLAQADLKYLKSNPELVSRLFSNLIWMYDNPEMAEELYADNRWMSANPEVSVQLHKNLRWLVAHPSAANQLYRDRTATQQLPELLGWRAAHKTLIRSMPDIEELFELDIIPKEIRVNR